MKRDSLWWFHDGHKAIRVGDWKAVAPMGEPWELYNLANDRDESTDLAVPAAGKLDSLISQWHQQLDSFVKLATEDIPQNPTNKGNSRQAKPRVNAAQQAAMPQRRQVLLSGKTFRLKDRHAFIMEPELPSNNESADNKADKPWIFYAPTLSAYPDKAESWMHQKFLDALFAAHELLARDLLLNFYSRDDRSTKDSGTSNILKAIKIVQLKNKNK